MVFTVTKHDNEAGSKIKIKLKIEKNILTIHMLL